MPTRVIHMDGQGCPGGLGAATIKPGQRAVVENEAHLLRAVLGVGQVAERFARLQDVAQTDAAVGECLPPLAYPGDHVANGFGITRRDGDEFSDWPAVHGDDEALAPPHAFEQLR
jgi:hypothetical protein